MFLKVKCYCWFFTVVFLYYFCYDFFFHWHNKRWTTVEGKGSFFDLIYCFYPLPKVSLVMTEESLPFQRLSSGTQKMSSHLPGFDSFLCWIFWLIQFGSVFSLHLFNITRLDLTLTHNGTCKGTWTVFFVHQISSAQPQPSVHSLHFFKATLAISFVPLKIMIVKFIENF